MKKYSTGLVLGGVCCLAIVVFAKRSPAGPVRTNALRSIQFELVPEEDAPPSEARGSDDTTEAPRPPAEAPRVEVVYEEATNERIAASLGTVHVLKGPEGEIPPGSVLTFSWARLRDARYSDGSLAAVRGYQVEMRSVYERWEQRFSVGGISDDKKVDHVDWQTKLDASNATIRWRVRPASNSMSGRGVYGLWSPWNTFTISGTRDIQPRTAP